jgi:hypothetical protein
MPHEQWHNFKIDAKEIAKMVRESTDHEGVKKLKYYMWL